MKVCRKCKDEKPLTEFYANRLNSDGKQSYCKVCSGALARTWDSANKDKVRAKQAAWRAANPEKVRASHAKWRAENPEKDKARHAAWRAANPEKAKASDKLANKSNMERISDCYISKVVKLPVATLPQELINMKREQLKMYRATKQLIQTIKETKDAS